MYFTPQSFWIGPNFRTVDALGKWVGSPPSHISAATSVKSSDEQPDLEELGEDNLNKESLLDDPEMADSERLDDFDSPTKSARFVNLRMNKLSINIFSLDCMDYTWMAFQSL